MGLLVRCDVGNRVVGLLVGRDVGVCVVGLLVGLNASLGRSLRKVLGGTNGKSLGKVLGMVLDASVGDSVCGAVVRDDVTHLTFAAQSQIPRSARNKKRPGHF